MIARLEGAVATRDYDRIVLDVHGVGYELIVPVRDIASVELGEKVAFFVAENIREDSYDLYGFRIEAERQLYRKLVSVNGVGAKMAHAIVSTYDAETLTTIIDAEEIARLSQVSGVGRKTAQRIILELRGKLVAGDSVGAAKSADPALQALIQLGYRVDQAQAALKDVDTSLDTSERVRQALREIG
ncbi:MAG: holliday junction helicase RuvA [Patescibacteria group bacterium]|jgi:Holliday junction DNA helicase RuvA|nr:holliday junction helicase RuvA [Patescibacteria group bacterium]